MTELQDAYLAKAGRALASAGRALEAGDVEVVLNRAYYACFYVAQAALDAFDEHPKSHKGTHVRFRYHYVATGRIPSGVAQTLPYAAQSRERTDYDAFVVSDLEAAADLLADAERFVEVVGGAIE